MSDRVAFIHSPALEAYRFGQDHPFNPLRLRLTVDLLRDAGVLTDSDVIEPREASLDELLLVHDRRYVDAVRAAGGSPGAPNVVWTDGFDLGSEDNPVFPLMHEATSRVVGASVQAAEMVMEGRVEHACSLGGGLHHAGRDRASGFCIYNDVAVAIAVVRRRYGARVMYVDTDAHHGDGVQWLFYDDPEVLTVSFHETGRHLFPGTGWVHERGQAQGYGYSVNVPLEAFTEDDSWLECLDLVLPALAEAFAPDLIITQNGCDGHALDPLAHLHATLRLYREIPRLAHQLAHAHAGGRWVALGGGGYEPWRVVPRAWAMVWSELSQRPLPGRIPEAWLARWQPRSPIELPRTVVDDRREYRDVPRREEIAARNRLTARQATEEAVQIIRSRGRP